MKTETTLLLGILCLTKGGCCAFTVEGDAGESIIIKCKYDKGYTKESKYFCQKTSMILNYCRVRISTNHQGWDSKQRVSLYDNKDEGFLTVIMRDITKGDEGKYWCAVDINWKYDEYSEVNLKVGKGIKNIYRVSGHTGHDVTIKCKYDNTDSDKRKYLCKNTAAGCEDIIRTDKKNQWDSRGRFSLYDNTTGRFLMVSISELGREDAGIYWCVVDEPFSAHSKVSVDKFTTINLVVNAAASPTLYNTTTKKSEVTSFATTVAPPLSPRQISKQDRQNHGFSVISPVSMAIMVVVIGMVFFVCVRRRKNAASGIPMNTFESASEAVL